MLEMRQKVQNATELQHQAAKVFFHDVYPPSFFPGSELVPFALLKPLSMMLKSALDTKIGAFPIGTLW